VAAEEVQLVGDGAVEAVAGVDAEVGDGVDPRLAARRPRGGTPGGTGRGERVGLAQGDEDRDGDPRGPAAGALTQDVEDGPGRDLVAPAGVRRHETPVAGLGVRGGQDGGRARRAGHRDQVRRLPPAGPRQVPDSGREGPPGTEGVGRGQGRNGSVGDRALSDDGGQAVRALRRDGDHVAAGEGGAPGDDAAAVRLGQVPGTGDRGLPVFPLPGDRQQLARLALAVAEVPVVEHQAGVTGRAEPAGVGGESHRPHAAEPVGHHDHRRLPGRRRRRRVREVQRRGALRSAAGEEKIPGVHTTVVSRYAP